MCLTRSLISVAHGVEVIVSCLVFGSADEERDMVAAHAATILINLSTDEEFRRAVIKANIVKESLKPLQSGFLALFHLQLAHPFTYLFSLRFL